MIDPADLTHPAQTNLQLYEQLRAAGAPVAELAEARRAHDLAARLFAGRQRANGKAFIAHVIGTAGILASLGARPPVMRAGLLHAAYTHGLHRGRRPSRAHVARHAGDEVERLVHAYASFPWSASAVAGHLARAGGLARDERDLVLMRVANELEDQVDLGLAYSKKRGEGGAATQALAERLGFPALAAALAETERAHAAARIPAELVSERSSAPPAHGHGLRGLVARIRAGIGARLGRAR